MKLQVLGANRTLLTVNDGLEIFFSYNTPVAAWVRGRGVVVTDKKWSTTTSKHIGEYKRRRNGSAAHPVETEPQEFFDRLTA